MASGMKRAKKMPRTLARRSTIADGRRFRLSRVEPGDQGRRALAAPRAAPEGD
jgi:hypothetical protein